VLWANINRFLSVNRNMSEDCFANVKCVSRSILPRISLNAVIIKKKYKVSLVYLNNSPRTWVAWTRNIGFFLNYHYFRNLISDLNSPMFINRQTLFKAYLF
jgi:hypothetical protein